MRYAHIIDGTVANVIELAPKSGWKPEKGYVVASEDAQIGHRYDGKTFTDPTPPKEPEPEKAREPTEIEVLQARVAALEADIAALKKG